MNDMRRVHAEQLVSSLELSLPPVAIAFCDVVPDDVPMFEGGRSRRMRVLVAGHVAHLRDSRP